MTTQKLILTIAAGLAALLMIGGFLYYDYKLALLLVLCGGLVAVIVYMFKVLVQQNEKLYNRNTYLTDVIMHIDPIIAHNINQVPPIVHQEGPGEGRMDIAGMEDVPFQVIKR